MQEFGETDTRRRVGESVLAGAEGHEAFEGSWHNTGIRDHRWTVNEKDVIPSSIIEMGGIRAPRAGQKPLKIAAPLL